MEFLDFHTHRRRGVGIEVLALRAGLGSGVSYRSVSGPFTMGLHPWDVGSADLKTALREVSEAIEYKAIAVGEIGLDRIAAIDFEAQMRAFEAQLALARENGLPVVVHCVRAFEDVAAALNRFGTQTAVFHGFIGSTEQARRIVDRGWLLSFGARSLGSPRTVEAMRAVPLDRVFLETDDSDDEIGNIYTTAAQLLDIKIDTLANQLIENYKKLLSKL